MKKFLCTILSTIFLTAAFPFAGLMPVATATTVPDSLKVLCIGNSFAVDTVEHVPNIALNAGIKNVKFATLYYGGCSINKHYNNAINNNAPYEYFINTGNGWTSTYNHTILSALQSEEWDWISIQHGTGDGSRYAEEGSYANLENLINYVKANAIGNPKIAFNMTWVGEKGSHEELLNSFNNDTIAYYNAICALTRDFVAKTPGLDRISPTGTAIQNARTANVGLLTRDNYHLSLTMGRYTAGLTFFNALTDVDVSGITWAPQGMTPYMKIVAIESATNAIATPYAITPSVAEEPVFEWPDNVPYGDPATPQNPYYEHAAKEAPDVNTKVDLLPYFNFGTTTPVVQYTIQTTNALGIELDLNKTPYLYYSFIIPEGSDFTFSIYSNATYSPWLSFLDASQGGAKLADSGETWDALFNNNRAQYATVSQTGCIDLRDYTTTDQMKWVINSLKVYAPKSGAVTFSYFFVGSEAQEKRVYRDTENLLPTTQDTVAQAGGTVDYIINDDGTFTIARAAASDIAWPSVRVTVNKTVNLNETPYLHLKMTTAGGYANGHLYYTKSDGTTGYKQLSAMVKGTNVDFTENLDAYVDLREALDTTGVITLTTYTLSVYGGVGAELTWEAYALAKDVTGQQISGDINNNGEIDTSDAAAILRHLNGIKPLDSATQTLADVNNDGKLNTIDVRYILRQLVE